MENLFAPDGPVQRALGDRFEMRPEQMRMASAVADAMDARSHLMVEAGTGVGKSFAYLLPAIDRVLRTGERVVVATNTIALQEQLIEKDVPLMRAIVETNSDDLPAGWRGELRPVLVKGRGNYLSIRRLKLASQRQASLLPDEPTRMSLHQIEQWAYETTDGTLSTLPQLERPEAWDHARSDADNCMGRKCPHYKECFYQRARREAENANLLICNHALFFADLALRVGGTGILPEYDHVVLDEAHGVEDVASEHFGLTLTEGRVNHLVRTLYDQRRRKGYLATLHQTLADADASRHAERAIEAALELRSASRRFFESWRRLHETGRLTSPRVRSPGMVEDVLGPAARELATRLRALRDRIEPEPDRFELNSYARRASDIADSASALVEHSLAHAVYWAEPERTHRGTVRISLGCAPIEVHDILREHLFSRGCSVTLTSATLTTRRIGADEPTETAETAFAHMLGRLGAEGARTLQLGSPFDHATQMEVYADVSMPSPKGRTTPELVEAMVPRILDHLIATDGGAFVLFTSFAMLGAVAAALEEPLGELGMPMLAHGRDGSRRELLQRFRRDERSVLLGADSFWQGVDVQGRGLRNVIITKLPFEPPDRPLTEARSELIRDRGGDPFRHDALPRAIIRFKQGFGRLVRSGRDVGRVVVLDPRLVTTSYGAMFRRALPEGVEVSRLHE